MSAMEKVTAFSHKLKLDRFTNTMPVKMVAGKLNVSPLIVVFVAFCLLVCMLAVTRLGRTLVEAFILFAYPAIKTHQAVKTVKSNDDHHWLTYWIVFCFIYSIQVSFPEALDWIPFWSILRIVLLGMIIHPRTKLNVKVHQNVIRLLIDRYDRWYEDLKERYWPSREHKRKRKRGLAATPKQ